MGTGATPQQVAGMKRQLLAYAERRLEKLSEGCVMRQAGRLAVARNEQSVTIEARVLHASNGETAVVLYVNDKHDWQDILTRVCEALNEPLPEPTSR